MRPRLQAATLVYGAVIVAPLLNKKSIMAHKPSSSAYTESIRFALFCTAVILRAFFLSFVFPAVFRERWVTEFSPLYY